MTNPHSLIAKTCATCTATTKCDYHRGQHDLAESISLLQGFETSTQSIDKKDLYSTAVSIRLGQYRDAVGSLVHALSDLTDLHFEENEGNDDE